PGLVDEPEIAARGQNLLAVGAGARQHATKRVDDERPAPELQAALDADAVGGGNEHAVGHRVAALHDLPSLALGSTELHLLRRMPADRRRIADDLRTAERREPRRFGKPL